MTFLQDSIDFFTGARVANIGMHHYAPHRGTRNGKPTSGAELWAEMDAAREAQAKIGVRNQVGSELSLLRQVSEEITEHLPFGIRVVELGPGTLSAFRKKTLPIIHALGSKECAVVDESIAFLGEIASSEASSGITIKPFEGNFWEDDHPYRDEAGPNLLCMFGSTISNIIAPLADELPQHTLTESLFNLSQSLSEGWMLVSFDGDQNGSRIKSYYEAHRLFQLNVFDRMAVELPVDSRFDPLAFDYEAEWRPRSGQIGHMAIVTRNMQFDLANRPITLRKGQRLHMKNSYKFLPEFFERCCRLAGLEVVKSWSESSMAHLYLLRKPAVSLDHMLAFLATRGKQSHAGLNFRS